MRELYVYIVQMIKQFLSMVVKINMWKHQEMTMLGFLVSIRRRSTNEWYMCIVCEKPWETTRRLVCIVPRLWWWLMMCVYLYVYSVCVCVCVCVYTFLQASNLQGFDEVCTYMYMYIVCISIYIYTYTLTHNTFLWASSLLVQCTFHILS